MTKASEHHDQNKGNLEYHDIIDLPHFQAPGHQPMLRSARAAQFMPFKSLKGYDELIAFAEDELSQVESHYVEDES